MAEPEQRHGGNDWFRPFKTFAVLQRGYDLPSGKRRAGPVPVIASNGQVGSHDEARVAGPGVVTGRSGTIGKVMVVEEDFWPLNTSLFVKDFRGNDYRFVALVLEHMGLVDYAGGSTVPSLDRKVLDGVLVPVPSMPEQRRIVDLVAAVDENIAAADTLTESAQAARSSLLSELLGAGGEDWVETTLGEVAVLRKEKADPKTLAADKPYIGLEHLESGATQITQQGRAGDVSSLVSNFYAGDTLFGRLRPYLRKVALADFAGVCSSELLVLEPITGRVLPAFLHLLGSSTDTIETCVARSAGSRMPRTSAADLLAVQVLLPPLVEQRRIVDLITGFDESIAAAQRLASASRQVRSALLTDLLSGDHEIPESYDRLLEAS